MNLCPPIMYITCNYWPYWTYTQHTANKWDVRSNHKCMAIYAYMHIHIVYVIFHYTNLKLYAQMKIIKHLSKPLHGVLIVLILVTSCVLCGSGCMSACLGMTLLLYQPMVNKVFMD